MMTPFSQSVRERFRHHSRDTEIVEEVTIRLEPDDCADFFGDELALWCHRHGFRARRMERSRRDVVRFGFHDAQAAAQFRTACGI
jgi:hypothetical protein